MTLGNLIGNLMAYEVQLEEEKRTNNNFNLRRKNLPSMHPQTQTIQITMKRR